MIAAEGEQKASHSLKEAAMVIQESPSALQVKINILACLIPEVKIYTIYCSLNLEPISFDIYHV